MPQLANVVFFFSSVECIPEDGRKRPEHVGGLVCDCMLLCLSVVQFLE
jgi:hypothetical protein